MAIHRSTILDAGMLCCALLLTAVVVHREVVSSRPPAPKRSTPIPNWSEIQEGANRLGPKEAPITIVEFSDFQCPYCEQFATKVLAPMRRLHPGEFSLIYRHWPLPMHDFAFDAAVASECAASVGKFEAYHDALFARQHDIGIRPLEQFAIDAGILDTNAFRKCRSSAAPASRVIADRQAARGLNSGGTPAFIVNGILLRAALDSTRLDSILAAKGRPQ